MADGGRSGNSSSSTSSLSSVKSVAMNLFGGGTCNSGGGSADSHGSNNISSRLETQYSVPNLGSTSASR